MATVCSDVISIDELNDNWSRMGNDLLSQADIKIMVPGHGIFRFTTLTFLSVYFSRVRWVWAKAIWKGGGTANAWIFCSAKS